MINQSDWNARLRSEAASWVEEGLIDESQRDKIVAKYPPATSPPPLPPTAKRASVKSRLPAVLVGLAVLLIGVGMILFYSANWKKMPSSVKLAQVLGMIVLSYGGAFFLLFGKRRWLAAGRGLLILGMLSFGAGLALIVQIYHISAHPARCVLLWAGFVAAMAAVTRDRFGLYLSLGLVLIWDIWERSVYGSPNYPMIIALAILFLLSRWLNNVVGQFVCALLAIVWFYAVNLHYLVEDQFHENAALFALMQIPFGILLISSAILLRDKVEDALSSMVRLIGWLAIYAPLIILSWPITFNASLIPAADEAGRPFLIEYGVVAVLSAVLVALVAWKRNGNWRFLTVGLVVGASLLLAPTRDPGIFMAIMLIALLLFHALTLLAGEQIKLPESSVITFVLVVVSLVVHSLGHFALTIDHDRLLVAAGMSGLLFIAVIFFMSLLISGRKGENSSPSKILPLFSIGLATLTLYIASFFSKEQEGILQPKPEWMIPALGLAGLAVGLGIVALFFLETNRKMMNGAFITTGIAIALMILPGDAIPPAFRQLILNALLFLIFGLVIAHAVEINSPSLVNLGVAAIVVLVLTRYFDVFWDMLHGAIFFIVTGLVLFSIACVMEWQRRRLLNQIEPSGKEDPAP